MKTPSEEGLTHRHSHLTHNLFVIPYTYAFASGLLPLDATIERQSGSTVHTGSTLSGIRKQERAAHKAAQIANPQEAREAAKGEIQRQAQVPVKEPSVRPYRKPEPVVKVKQVVRTISEHDGRNLLRKIEAHGGRDIIVMMCDSQRTPQELAEDLMRDEAIVIKSLNTHGNGKDRIERLLAAIEQAPLYLKSDEERPITTGVRKRKRQDEAQAQRDDIASRKRHPKTRTLVAPTLAEVAPKREDQHIMFEELKQYLELNADLRDRVMNASSDLKAIRILLLNVGPRFGVKVKALLAAPSEYQDLLCEAGATIRRDARKYDTSDTPLEGPTPTVQESPEAIARHRSQEAVLAKFTRAAQAGGNKPQSDADTLEAEATRERFDHQEDALRIYLGARA